MRCWNCGTKIPADAKVCGYCEAAVKDEPSAEEIELVRGIVEEMPPEALEELQKAMLGSATAEEFVDSIFVGECPKCGSEDTGNCESDPEIGEFVVGRCYKCGQLWCTLCGKLLTAESPTCECWDDDDIESLFQ
jgi:hypothetical protein